MSDFCPFCTLDSARVLAAVARGWLFTCTSCYRLWTVNDQGVVV